VFGLQNTVKTLEEEIHGLQSEKENLSTALLDAKTKSAANKYVYTLKLFPPHKYRGTPKF